MHKIVLLDRCNLERADRKQWLEAGNVAKNEVIAVYIDVPEVPAHIICVEPPTELEGYRAVLRLKATAAAAQDLVRRWTEEGYTLESSRGLQDRFPVSEEQEEGDTWCEECLPPAMPTLNQWIEVQENGGHTAGACDLWGMPLGDPIDFPLDLLPGNFDERYVLGPITPSSASDVMAPGGWSSGAELEATAEAEEAGQLDRLLQRAHERFQPMQAWDEEAPSSVQPGLGVPWPGAAAATMSSDTSATAALEEDEEDMDREEQLAATLRCMGFDEEPSLLAAQRAGGNLNVAVESMLRGGSDSNE
jgi:hypothetical protein